MNRRYVLPVLSVAAVVLLGVQVGDRGDQFGFWQAIGRATGTRDDLGPVDFSRLERRSSPNDSLICAADICPRAAADGEAPVFPTPSGPLLERMRAIALAEPRTDELSAPGEGRLRFVQRSLLMRFPDIIDVLASPRGEDASTLALYSRSAVGQSDLGVNRARLERWMAALKR